jgi:hypothetical protein
MKPSKSKGSSAMKASSPPQAHRRTFLWIVLSCIALAVGYTSWGILRAKASTALVRAQGAPRSIAQPGDLEAVQKGPM